MGNSTSVLSRIWGLITTLLSLAVMAWLGWYAYSQWASGSDDASRTAEEDRYNCRQALARIASDYACLNSDTCDLSEGERAALRQRETDAAEYCN